ncbi:CAAX geranylgeranyltransferase alpha subunit [Mortierella sp. AD011]|nr:CAAX geranylgeranyltransferase alpha subunit [Mortierella sp. AD010]KAF9380186.1 CAAX geranylgeranyltransferase alpha subunit [Mortierella sp. AD011]
MDEVPFYEKPEWADVVPIPQDDGPNPLVPIAYTKDYSTTMDYFRAICRSEEQSERALELTKIVIEMCPSHYTVWHCRQRLLKALNKDLTDELEWIKWMSSENPKSYQIWHHRQVLVDHISAVLLPASSATSETASSLITAPTIPYHELSESQQKAARDMVKVELDFIATALEEDSKNYHAWSYRQWVLTHFGQGPWWEEELSYIDGLLEIDVRNNSAWNQRFYIVSAGPQGFTEEIVQREIEILHRAKHPLSEVKEFCEGLVSRVQANLSPFLHSTLLDIYEQEAKEQKKAESLSKAKSEAALLAEKIDPIRKKYWDWKKTQLDSITVEA